MKGKCTKTLPGSSDLGQRLRVSHRNRKERELKSENPLRGMYATTAAVDKRLGETENEGRAQLGGKSGSCARLEPPKGGAKPP